MGMNPEQKARQEIDQLLEKAGWKVQDYRELNLGTSLEVAIREFPVKSCSINLLGKYPSNPVRIQLHVTCN
ncbi:MAG: hypothetical protein A2Y81_09080 [Nitrospirae bacterium RBG_13_43_8]|nr:MAG: hypothetical protein A2Y81_09080 [Nitrospirae bacterium RBG_13_43_8]